MSVGTISWLNGQINAKIIFRRVASGPFMTARRRFSAEEDISASGTGLRGVVSEVRMTT